MTDFNSPDYKDIDFLQFQDFKLIREIGKGAFSKVYLSEHIKTKQSFALKITDKSYLIKEKRLHHFYIEKELLSTLNHPLIAKVFSGYEYEDKLITIMEYYKNGDLFDFIKMNKPLKIDVIKHLSAQLVTALGFLRQKGIIHRDLKPENILIDENIYIKIGDFATAKIKNKKFNLTLMKYESCNLDEEDLIEDKEKDFDNKDIKARDTFCGTAEYVSPEMITGQSSSYSSDYWALGCIIYHMIYGVSPFKHKSPYIIFENIRTLNITFTDDINAQAKDLIKKLLVHKEKHRLGFKDISEIAEHEFFNTDQGISLVDTIYKFKIPMRNSFITVIDKETSLDNTSKKYEKAKVIKSALVEKKSPYFHYNTRRLTLDSTPKLNYIHPSSNIVKGTIYLSNNCEAKLQKSDKFELITPKRTFTFISNNALDWCRIINEEINKMSIDK